MKPSSAVTRPSWPAFLLALLLAWVVGYPLLLTAWGALQGPDGLTFDYFHAFATRADEWAALSRSLVISLLSVLLSALVGVPLAFLFERAEFPGRRWLGGLLALPVALPPLVGVIAFLFLYGESGFLARGLQHLLRLEQAPWSLQGAWAILLVHTYSMYVYFYLFVRAALARLDGSLLEAAAALGASRGRILWRVVLPQLRPALLAAALLTFMTSLGSFSAPYIFGGTYRVMTTQILASKVAGEVAMAQVEALTLAALAWVALVGIRKVQGQFTAVSSHGVAPARRELRSRWSRLMAATAGWALALFMLLPHLTLVALSFVPLGTWTTELVPPSWSWVNYRDLFAEPSRLQPIVNSLWMATVAALGAGILGLLAARAALRHGGRLGQWLETLIALPWAIPGTVFALALSVAFSVDQPHLLRFVLVGTPLILPMAYLVRCLPVTGRSSLAGLRQLDPAVEEAGASLGASPLRILWKVVLPHLRPALQAAVGLSFITALGDYVTSVVLYTHATRPISIEIATALRVQEFGIAAAYGVLLMVLSTAAFLLWGRGDAG